MSRRDYVSAYHSPCEDCERCDECGEVAYCLGTENLRPCLHDRQLCGDHNIEGCPECRREAETDMYRGGQYDPRADPFFRPGADDGFDPVRSWNYGIGVSRKEKHA